MGCVDAGWVDTSDDRFQPLEQWSLAGHLIYDGDDGFDVRSLTYEEGTAYTTEIMNLAVKEFIPALGARFLDLTVGPGSMDVDGEVLPTFNLQVQCPGRHAELLAALLGKSLSLKNFQRVKAIGSDGIYAVDICESNGFRNGDREFVNSAAEAIGARLADVELGFAFTPPDGEPSIPFFDFEDSWEVTTFEALCGAVDAVARERGLNCTMQRFIAEMAPHGSAITVSCFLDRYEPLLSEEYHRAPYPEVNTFIDLVQRLFVALGPSEFKRRRESWRAVLLPTLEEPERGLFAGLQQIHQDLYAESGDERYLEWVPWLEEQRRVPDDD